MHRTLQHWQFSILKQRHLKGRMQPLWRAFATGRMLARVHRQSCRWRLTWVHTPCRCCHLVNTENRILAGSSMRPAHTAEVREEHQGFLLKGLHKSTTLCDEEDC